MSHDRLKLKYNLIDLSVVHKKSVKSFVIKIVFVSVDYLISTLANGRCEYLLDVKFFVKYALFLLSAGIPVPCQLPINFSVDNLEYIYNIVSYVNSLNEKGKLPRTFLHNPRQLNLT